MWIERFVATALAAALAWPVGATSIDKVDRGNGMFFNRPGAALDDMARDSGECLAIAAGAESQINGVDVVMGGLGAVIGGAIAGGRLKRVNVENCMLVRGWRLFAMTREEGAKWKAMADPARKTALATLVGAETPATGTLLRVWHNDYAEPVLWQKD